MKIKGVDIDKRISSIKASMAYEGLELSDKDIEDCRKILLGEMTADESCKQILDRYNQK